MTETNNWLPTEKNIEGYSLLMGMLSAKARI
jgi:hypothetical protein